jgi:hypothetical protein
LIPEKLEVIYLPGKAERFNRWSVCFPKLGSILVSVDFQNDANRGNGRPNRQPAAGRVMVQKLKLPRNGYLISHKVNFFSNVETSFNERTAQALASQKKSNRKNVQKRNH